MILGRPRFAFSWLVAGRASNFQGRRQLNKTIKNQLGNIWLWGGRQALSDGQLQQNQIKSPLRCLNDMEWNYVTIKKRDDESLAQNLAKMTSDLAWIALDWSGLDWTGLDWIGLGWTGLDWSVREGGKASVKRFYSPSFYPQLFLSHFGEDSCECGEDDDQITVKSVWPIPK